jgi:hypothetical protein
LQEGVVHVVVQVLDGDLHLRRFADVVLVHLGNNQVVILYIDRQDPEANSTTLIYNYNSVVAKGVFKLKGKYFCFHNALLKAV